MKNIFKYSAALLFIGLTVLTGCRKDELSTSQFDENAVGLSAYGPQPVARGGELRFIGSHLERIASVIFPGTPDPVEVTDIKVVSSGVPSEIRVTVPVEGPEEGLLTLVAKDGTRLSTKTELTYLEPITIESISPASPAVLYPGEELTIKGDYLNLINMVVFAENVQVSGKAFVKQSRYEIVVNVPVEARAGAVGVGDVDKTLEENADVMSNVIYSEDEITVTLPEVTTVSADSWRPESTVTVTGQYMELVDFIQLPGAEVETFTKSDDNTTITFELPAKAASGNILLVAKSGAEIVAKEDFEAVLPSGLTVSPAKVKAGEELVISGQNLDLVTSVTLPEEIILSEELWTYSENQIKFNMPAEANEGLISLGLANGMAATVEYELVKPTFTSYSSASIAAGSNLTINGEALDIVTTVTFPEDIDVTPLSSSQTALSVTVPVTAKSGKVILNLANGSTIECPELTVSEPTVCIISNLPDGDETIYGGQVLILDVENGDLLTDVQVNGTSVTHMVSDSKLYLQLPLRANLGTIVTLISGTEGSVDYTIDCMPGNMDYRVIWTGEHNVGNWEANTDLSGEKFDWSTVTLGEYPLSLRFDIELDSSQTEWNIALQLPSGNWPSLSENGNITLSAGQTSASVSLTQNMLDEINSVKGLAITGKNYTLKKITIVADKREATTIWEGERAFNWVGLELTTEEYKNKFADIEPGATIFAEYKDANNAGISLNDGNWKLLPCVNNANEWNTVNLSNGAGVISYDLSAEDIELLTSTGLIVNGAAMTLTKIYYKY